jgi:hypothetical protein
MQVVVGRAVGGIGAAFIRQRLREADQRGCEAPTRLVNSR